MQNCKFIALSMHANRMLLNVVISLSNFFIWKKILLSATIRMIAPKGGCHLITRLEH